MGTLVKRWMVWYGLVVWKNARCFLLGGFNFLKLFSIPTLGKWSNLTNIMYIYIFFFQICWNHQLFFSSYTEFPVSRICFFLRLKARYSWWMVWILLASFFQTLLGKDFPILTNWNLEALFSFHFWDEIRFRPIFGFIVPSLVITNMAFPKKAACFCFSPPCAVRSSYPTDPTTLMVMVWYSKNPTEGPNFCFILGEVLWAEEPRRFCESRKFAKNWIFGGCSPKNFAPDFFSEILAEEWLFWNTWNSCLCCFCLFPRWDGISTILDACEHQIFWRGQTPIGKSMYDQLHRLDHISKWLTFVTVLRTTSPQIC